MSICLKKKMTAFIAVAEVGIDDRERNLGIINKVAAEYGVEVEK